MSLIEQRRPTRAGLAYALGAGLLLTVIALAAPIMDHTAGNRLGAHLNEVYAGYPGRSGADALVLAYLSSVQALGVAGWLVTSWAAGRRKRWTAPVAVALFVLGLAVAVFDLTVTEYGQTLLPLGFGLLGLLPCVPGAVVVGLLRRHRPRRT